jgi:hypothetical protein
MPPALRQSRPRAPPPALPLPGDRAPPPTSPSHLQSFPGGRLPARPPPPLTPPTHLRSIPGGRLPALQLVEDRAPYLTPAAPPAHLPQRPARVGAPSTSHGGLETSSALEQSASPHVPPRPPAAEPLLPPARTATLSAALTAAPRRAPHDGRPAPRRSRLRSDRGAPSSRALGRAGSLAGERSPANPQFAPTRPPISARAPRQFEPPVSVPWVSRSFETTERAGRLCEQPAVPGGER